MVQIYALADPLTNEIRYIGKAANMATRFASHTWQARHRRRTHRDCWHWSLIRRGLNPNVVIIADAVGEGSEEERYYIRLAKMAGVRLTNATEGGEGISGFRFRMPDEARRKISAALTGIKRSDETREKLRRAITGRTIQTPESRRRISAANLGRVHSPEWVEKRIAPLRNQKRPASVGEKVSLAKRGKPGKKWSADERERSSRFWREWHKSNKRVLTPEGRARHREAMRTVPAETEATILSRYADGVPLAKLSASTGVARQAIMRLVRRAGVKMHRAVYHERLAADTDAVIGAYLSGMRIKDIRTTFRCDLKWLYRTLESRGIPRRAKDRIATAARSAPPF